VYKANSFSETITNNRKQFISGNDAAGPQLRKNVVSVTQRIFGCDCLLGAMQLTLTSGYTGKAAFGF